MSRDMSKEEAMGLAIRFHSGLSILRARAPSVRLNRVTSARFFGLAGSGTRAVQDTQPEGSVAEPPPGSGEASTERRT